MQLALDIGIIDHGNTDLKFVVSSADLVILCAPLGAVAMLANLNPIGVIFSGVFLASIYVGADAMSRAMNVPTYLADVIVALTVLCILLSLVFVHYKILFFKAKKDD